MPGWKINTYVAELSRPLAGERGFPHKGTVKIDPGAYIYVEQWGGIAHGRQWRESRRTLHDNPYTGVPPHVCYIVHPVLGRIELSRSILDLKSVKAEFYNKANRDKVTYYANHGAHYNYDGASRPERRHKG